VSNGSEPSAAPDPIDGVVIDDDTHLRVAVGCPSDQPTVGVTESDADVRLSATYTATNLLCQKAALVVLASPLAQRTVVDVSTGQPARIFADNR
jgi:hypothetical protein